MCLFIFVCLLKKLGLLFLLYDIDVFCLLNDVVGDVKIICIKQVYEWYMMLVWIILVFCFVEDSVEIIDDEYDVLQEVFWVNVDWFINKELFFLQNDDLVYLCSGLVKLLGVVCEKVFVEKKEFYDFC